MAAVIHKFGAGNRYNTYTPENVSEYLDAALEAEQYVSLYEKQTEDGIYWSVNEDGNPDLSLFIGSTGDLYYYLKLYQALEMINI